MDMAPALFFKLRFNQRSQQSPGDLFCRFIPLRQRNARDESVNYDCCYRGSQHVKLNACATQHDLPKRVFHDATPV
jgi:hypothetical protein